MPIAQATVDGQTPSEFTPPRRGEEEDEGAEPSVPSAPRIPVEGPITEPGPIVPQELSLDDITESKRDKQSDPLGQTTNGESSSKEQQ